ncbi:MAG TPA: hypothetical protein VF559_05975 [Caulobacteraceae bacterium]|jgi:hypothetical protein
MDVLSIFARIGYIGFVGLALLGATALFAWTKGGAAERGGTLVYAVAWLGVLIYELVTGDSFPVVPILMLDAGVALAFLALAIRYNSLWLGGAMILQGLGLGLHAAYLTDLDNPEIFLFYTYALGINLVSFGILVLLIVGTAITMVDLRRHRRVVMTDAPLLVA